MSKSWRMVRLPVELAERLDRECREAELAHIEGRGALPAAYVEHCPLHYAITRILDSAESLRERSRK